jgi:hypothetical protein
LLSIKLTMLGINQLHINSFCLLLIVVSVWYHVKQSLIKIAMTGYDPKYSLHPYVSSHIE